MTPDQLVLMKRMLQMTPDELTDLRQNFKMYEDAVQRLRGVIGRQNTEASRQHCIDRLTELRAEIEAA